MIETAGALPPIERALVLRGALVSAGDRYPLEARIALARAFPDFDGVFVGLSDVTGAWDEVELIDDIGFRLRLQRALIPIWGQQDPETLFGPNGHLLGAPLLGTEFMTAYVDWSRTNPEEALAWSSAQTDGGFYVGLTLAELTTMDFQMAWDAWQQIPPGKRSCSLLRASSFAIRTFCSSTKHHPGWIVARRQGSMTSSVDFSNRLHLGRAAVVPSSLRTG